MLAAFLSLFLLTAAPAEPGGQTDLLGAVRSGEAVLLMRHALAPGTGDPVDFSLEDCATQRNLNAVGRMQARATGRMLAEAGLSDAEVFTSAWCRCRETAELLALGPVEPLAALNSFFRRFERREAQTGALREFLASRTRADGPAVLVTHQVNITALTDVFPSSGEIVVVGIGAQAGEVLGRIAAMDTDAVAVP